MRLGCFGFSGDLEAIRRAGFDFAELDLMELSRMSDAQFAEFLRRAKDSGLGFDAFSGFMPLTERIHSPEFDKERWFEHARRMADRTCALGAVLWPLGAGKCRSIPEGDSAEAARAKVREFFSGIAGEVAPYGIKLLIGRPIPTFSIPSRRQWNLSGRWERPIARPCATCGIWSNCQSLFRRL